MNKEQAIQVSVVIPAYNMEDYIGRAIKSVLTQTRPADEIIVVDDGSTDGTAAQIKKFGSQVRYIHQDNSGVSAARNTGIKAAKYEWIALLDGDDEWLAEKLQLQSEHLVRNPELVWAGSNYYRCLCNENRRGPTVSPKQVITLLKGKEYFDDFFRAFPARAYGWTGTMLIKKEIIEQAGMFRVGQLLANDLDMWFRIAYRQGRIGFIPEPLAVYHLNIPHSITETHKNIDLFCDLIERHLDMSREYGRSSAFIPCASHMVCSRIRGMLFENDPEAITKLLNKFGYLTRPRFRVLVRLLMIFPGLTAKVCRGISHIVRFFNLRRQVIRRPE